MVHALREVHRVLRPGGIVVDLRPAAERRRIGLGRDRRWRQVGPTRETFEKDRAANRAVAVVLRAGLFVRGRRAEFVVDREMDAMDDFVTWLTDFGERRTLASHAGLIARLKRGLAARPRPIVARGPVTLQLLRKPE
jgi:SAM-dependent methyltransferase